jgi:hypothetical protein
VTKRQFRVLYRDFLFRLVDRDLLSAQADGDASKLLGQFITVLILLGLGLTLLVLGIPNGHVPRQAVFVAAWNAEHTLIATTMLVIGLFAVLSWDSTFPDRRDVLVLAPLPVRPSTIFFAKVASLAAALSLTVIAVNALPSFVLIYAVAPPDYNVLEVLLSPASYQILFAYWVTMVGAGTFLFCSILFVQGLAAQLRRRLFLRLSSFLQMTALCVFVAVYFLQPSLATPQPLADQRNQSLLTWLPSYWFLGIFQELNGSLNGPARSTLAALATRAWIGLACAMAGAGVAYVLSYFRTLRKIVEQPDILPGPRRLTWLPRFGNSLETAVVQFSIRTLFRSRQHRLILSFYAGIGFAILILFLKTPIVLVLAAKSAAHGWQQVSLPLLASSFVMMCFWALGIRAVFALPLELKANWIFRLTAVHGTMDYLAASRRAMFVLIAIPVWVASIAVFLALWPWRPAVEHLAVLGLLGITLTELCLHGFHKIPFTCSYLPGKSNFHIKFWLFLMLGLNITFRAADFERSALSDPSKYAWILGILGVAAFGARWRTQAHASSEETRLLFEEEWSPVILGLGLRRDGTFPMEPLPRKTTGV